MIIMKKKKTDQCYKFVIRANWLFLERFLNAAAHSLQRVSGKRKASTYIHTCVVDFPLSDDKIDNSFH